jgi:exodeoxyribonuclease V alpha subunit
MTKPEVLRGLVDRVVFHNEENGFCILKVVPAGRQDMVSLIGKAPRVVAGEEFEARGVWEPNRDFGPQFKSDELKLRRPDSLSGIERYLGSGLIKGIGPAHAKTSRVWEKSAASRSASRG